MDEIIHVYSRAQALADGVLVDVTATAKEAGFRVPVALTSAVWEDCVAWTDGDDERKGTVQDEDGRLWDVLFMAYIAARRSGGASRVTYTIARVPRDGDSVAAEDVELILAIGPGDVGEPVITIMQAGDD